MNNISNLETLANKLGWLNIGLPIFFSLIVAIVAHYTAQTNERIFKIKEKDSDRKISEAKEGAAVALEATEKYKVEQLKLEIKIKESEALYQQMQIELAQAIKAQMVAELNLKLLEEDLAPRHLTAEQKSSLLAKLSPNYPNVKKEVNITFIGDDPECQDYANEFIEIFKKAGWVLKMANGVVYIGNEAGLTLRAPMNSAKNVLQSNTIVRDAIQDSNIKYNFHFPARENSMELIPEIFIGKKIPRSRTQ